MGQTATTKQIASTRLLVTGRIQGVGFRPFVCRLAQKMGLRGYVRNTLEGAEILLQGDSDSVQLFSQHLSQQLPSPGHIDTIHIATIWANAQEGFRLDKSLEQGRGALPLEDRAICEQCKEDLQNSLSRFYQYPFVSCTACGPRFSIVDSLPWDKERTSMAAFPFCQECEALYLDSDDRRFHAQTLACPHCGPSVWLVDQQGQPIVGHSQALIKQAQGWLKAGKILAIKGIGGFHLCCDAENEHSIARLRLQKRRPDKPLALMFHSVAAVNQAFCLDSQSMDCLAAPSAPIVLLHKHHAKMAFAENIAPNQAKLGVMLAYSPLHVLLSQGFPHGLVMTSGNISGAPLCYQNEEALAHLFPLADGFVLHNRAIVHAQDDSLVSMIANKPMVLRRARGFVPEALSLPPNLHSQKSVLALGGDLKNVMAQSANQRMVLSAHHGNLTHPQALEAATADIATLQALTQQQAELIVVDSHPDYQSHQLGKRLAQTLNLPLFQVQHHHAHMAACLAENQWQGKQALGIVLDGLGYGEDGSLWGGEFLLGNYQSVKRLGRLAPSPLLGNDKANVEPWRCLITRLKQAGCWPLAEELLQKLGIDNHSANLLLRHQGQFMQSSSAGRLFDAVACLLDVAPYRQSFEGQAAMALETLALAADSATPSYPFKMIKMDSLWELNPAPIWPLLLVDLTKKSCAQIAADFHQSLVAALVKLCKQINQEASFDTVALSGGVMQNDLLVSALKAVLECQGFAVLLHEKVPPNDGGLALGQAAVALANWEAGSCV
ncbi:carbamoyltransferase HypF [Aliiglaciecola sp. CAU 1673]|uniref:carbamoyltransferase HypF n=1 Tax=Aliiglaciecola sp. CAU 1673 TaxID=3032595 RepID=UPI0023D9F27B|nr:carbamoyltransferase HypF [Aliiglaciecola sp. CAU 1673]MDF2180185.1 carbamoyltransferase HypF [Aliiglaciecola sp. CAU 1673]